METTISSVVLSYLKGEIASLFNFPENQFYAEVRDDSKEKSVTTYRLDNAQDVYTHGEQVNRRIAIQIQIVAGLSISKTEHIAEWVYENLVVKDNGKIQNSGFEFYIVPYQKRPPKYLGTLDSGYHKYGIDVLVIYHHRKDD